MAIKLAFIQGLSKGCETTYKQIALAIAKSEKNAAKTLVAIKKMCQDSLDNFAKIKARQSGTETKSNNKGVNDTSENNIENQEENNNEVSN